jgi:hypothetical protein
LGDKELADTLPNTTEEELKRFLVAALLSVREYISLPNDLGWHVRLQLPGMEGQLLSRDAAGLEDAAVLRGTVFNRRDQLHVLPGAHRKDSRRMGSGDARPLQADAEGAEALTHDARLRGTADRVRQFLETASILGPKLGACCSNCRQT